MSYYETIPGAGKHGFTEGMGAAFPSAVGGKNRATDEGLRALQQNLLRMNLEPRLTANGLWDLWTISALTKANTKLGRTTAPWKPTNASRNVTVPDDLIAAIQAAADAAAAPSGSTLDLMSGSTPPSSPPISSPATFAPDPSTTTPDALATPLLPPVVQETTPSSNTRLYLIGGSIAVVAVGAAAFMLWPRKKVTPNRRRSVKRKR